MRSKWFGIAVLRELIWIYMSYYSCRVTLNKKNPPSWYTMTPISHSRGIMYSAPPKETTRREEESVDEPTESNESSDDVEAPTVTDATSSVTDANWTGTVPADD